MPLKIVEVGSGELLGWMDPDDARDWIAEHKSRMMQEKLMSIGEAVKKFTFDSGYLAMGGFGHVRVSMNGIYEMIRQKRRHIIIAGKTAVHDVDVLISGNVVDRVECAYSFGHELRGLSPAGRRAVEKGNVKIVAELSNAGFQWRFKAAAMGLPWLPARVMLGTDTFRYSSSRVVEDPFTGKPLCIIPACYPDFSFIHVHRSDKYGNSQIDGITIEDKELAAASKRLIITTEEIVTNESIRETPDKTTIPFYMVDAVVKVPYGSHPGNMPLRYYSDEEHMTEWLSLSRTQEGVEKYLDKYVYSPKDWDEYLKLNGGDMKMELLRKLERLEVKLSTPWARR